MREILFRGKRIDNGEWVCSGNIFHLNENGGEYYIPNINTKCTTTHECNSIGEYGNISAIVCKNDTRLYKVNPETVGQYTGLTDKNGRKIFEGDCFKMYCTGLPVCLKTYCTGLPVYKHIVGYYPEHFAFMARCIEMNTVHYLSDYRPSAIEVIGNIHDNPELLEEVN